MCNRLTLVDLNRKPRSVRSLRRRRHLMAKSVLPLRVGLNRW